MRLSSFKLFRYFEIVFVDKPKFCLSSSLFCVVIATVPVLNSACSHIQVRRVFAASGFNPYNGLIKSIKVI